jgi:hypothetical protein
MVHAPPISSTALDDAVEELLVQSLAAWRVEGNVTRDTDGALLVTSGERRLHVSRAPTGLPLRWMVAEGERTRGAASVSGLLRHVRAVIDPGYRPVRLRIAPLPLVAP